MHLTECSNPDFVANKVSGATYQKDDVAYQMLLPSNPHATYGLVLYDGHRLPQYAYRGETLHINPESLTIARTWGDKLAKDEVYQMVTDPAQYARYGAEPAGESPHNENITPVDLLITGLGHTLLHEVRFAYPVCSVYYVGFLLVTIANSCSYSIRSHLDP